MTATPSRRPRTAFLVVGALLLAALFAGGAYGFSYLFFREEAPPPVGAASVDASASDPATSTAPESEEPASSADAAAAGTWSVDTSIGSFDDFSGSFVGYRVQEELASVGAATAVGRTPDVTGNLVLDGTALTSVEITADLTTLESDDDRRDGQLRRQGIETEAYPTATFVLAEPVDLPDGALDGETVDVVAVGDLTLHGVTQGVEVPITATLADGVITVTGSIEIAFADYDIEKPTSFAVLSVDDVGIMEFQLHFTES